MAKKKHSWKKGPPPFCGWWVASRIQDETSWRWWNGAQWSNTISEHATSGYPAARAKTVTHTQSAIEWTDFWPEGARVPRVDPRVAL